MPEVQLTEKDHTLVERSRTLLRAPSWVDWIWLIHPVAMLGIGLLCFITFYFLKDVMSASPVSKEEGMFLNLGFFLGLCSGGGFLGVVFGLREFFTDRSKRKTHGLIVKLYEMNPRWNGSHPDAEQDPRQTGDKT